MADEAKIDNVPEVDASKAEDKPKIADFINTLEAAQRGEHAEIQAAAEGINVEKLKLAFENVAAQDEVRIEKGGEEAESEKEAELDDESQREALNKGFEFASKAVKLLQKSPDTKTLLALYAYFKIGTGEKAEKPGSFSIDMQKKYKYNAWKERNHHSKIKAQQIYIEKVDELINEQGGLRE